MNWSSSDLGGIKYEAVGKMEAAPRFELGVKVLQTSALPLGYAAAKRFLILSYFRS